MGVIDVENAVAADPLHDLAKTNCYSIRGDPATLAGLLEGYEITHDEPATLGPALPIVEGAPLAEQRGLIASSRKAESKDAPSSGTSIRGA